MSTDLILDGRQHTESTDILGVRISYAGFSCGCYTIGTDTTAIFVACKSHFHGYHRGLLSDLAAHNKKGPLTKEDKQRIEDAYYAGIQRDYYK